MYYIIISIYVYTLLDCLHSHALWRRGGARQGVVDWISPKVCRPLTGLGKKYVFLHCLFFSSTEKNIFSLGKKIIIIFLKTNPGLLPHHTGDAIEKFIEPISNRRANRTVVNVGWAGLYCEVAIRSGKLISGISGPEPFLNGTKLFSFKFENRKTWFAFGCFLWQIIFSPKSWLLRNKRNGRRIWLSSAYQAPCKVQFKHVVWRRKNCPGPIGLPDPVYWVFGRKPQPMGPILGTQRLGLCRPWSELAIYSDTLCPMISQLFFSVTNARKGDELEQQNRVAL